MIVEGGKTFLNSQGKATTKSREESDSKSFQDLLSGARKKKPSNDKEVRKQESKPVKSKSLDVDDTQTVTQRRDVPARKKEEFDSPAQKPFQTQPVQKQVSQADKETLLQAAPSKEFLVEREMGAKGGLKAENLFSNEMQQSKPVASLTLSGDQNKTLQENQKIVQNLESSFEKVMSELKAQGQSGQVMKGLAKGQAMAVKQPVAGAAAGKFKIDPKMEISEGGETLVLDSGEGTKALKAVTAAKDSETGDQLSSQLESLLGQQVELDPNGDAIEGTQFVDEMQLAQNSEKSQKIENMHSIIKQARAAVDDGGGTMEIHLQPEGLGKVHLKVGVQDGQVNVEMMTDNLAAKKALEEGLFDIKNALEGQKLLVETLKVEMSPDYQKDFTDLQQHMQEQANRDFAEQFLDQFKQEREAKMGGMFDSFRNFKRMNNEPELTLRKEAYLEQGKGHSVNLVA